MRLPIALGALAVSFFLMPVVAGYAPTLSQDFSITNPVAPTPVPAFPGRPNLMRQLQAWWDVHAYYPKHASNNDEGGTVKIHLNILPDGRVWAAKIVESSGSQSIDGAAVAVFKGAFVTRAQDGTPEADPGILLHYVLAHRHDQPVPVGYKSVPSRVPFTIANDPVTSPILNTMLQRTCTGEVVKQGIRNHPAYGQHNWAQAVFFRKPDGTPWVKFYEGGYPTFAPVTEIGKMVQWTGRQEFLNGGTSWFTQYTAWADDDNHLSGNLTTDYIGGTGFQGINHDGTIDFTCATEIAPPIASNGLLVQNLVNPPGDPP